MYVGVRLFTGVLASYLWSHFWTEVHIFVQVMADQKVKNCSLMKKKYNLGHALKLEELHMIPSLMKTFYLIHSILWY